MVEAWGVQRIFGGVGVWSCKRTVWATNVPEEVVTSVECLECFVTEDAADGEERLYEGTAVVPEWSLDSYSSVLLECVSEDALAQFIGKPSELADLIETCVGRHFRLFGLCVCIF